MTNLKHVFISLIIAPAFVLFSLFSCNSTAQDGSDALPSLEGKKVLMVWGGWPGHKPKEFTDKIAAWLETQNVDLTISDSLGIYTDSAYMASVDLIIQYWTMGQITKEQEKGLLTAVKNGAGIAGCHGGLGDSFRNNTEYQYMVGGQWVAHPGGQIDYHINITDQDDPITKGIPNFDLHTEQYFMHIDPNVKVLATTTFNGEHDSWIDGSILPLIWKKYYGEGRIFYFSVGHSPDMFDIEEPMTILQRGLRWASGSKYEAKETWVSPIYQSGGK